MISPDLSANAQSSLLGIEERLRVLERRRPEVTAEMLSKLRDDMRREVRAAIGEPTYRDWEEVFGGPVVVSRGGMTLRPILPATVTIDGALSATPVFGLWSKTTTDAAGLGYYAWDTESYNSDPTLFARVNANQDIQINVGGTYDIRVNVFAQDTTLPVGTQIQWFVYAGGVARAAMHNALLANTVAWAHASKIVNVTAGQSVAVYLASQPTSQKVGDPGGYVSWIEVCRVN